MRGNPKLQVTRAEDTSEMLRLRRDGWSYRAIGEHFAITHSSVYERVQKALHDTVAESADEVRTLELERLDKMQARLEAKIEAGDMKAIATALSIMDRRAKYLGIDAPAKTEVTVALQETSEIDAAVAELVAAMKAQDEHASTDA